MLATLTVAGWIFMLISTLGVTAWMVWCFWRVMTLPPEADGDHGGDEGGA